MCRKLYNDIAHHFFATTSHVFSILSLMCALCVIFTASGKIVLQTNKQNRTNKLHGLSPRANYTDRATADCRRNDCQLLRIIGATWSA
jgi:hypothetical protein